MARFNSNAKGATFERKTCERLSLWVSDGARSDLFWRSAMSGGRANLRSHRIRGLRFEAQAGDVSAIHPKGRPLTRVFLIECKFYRSLDLDCVLFGFPRRLPDVWLKPRREAREHGKIPLVVMKQNRSKPLVATTREGLRLLRQAGSVPLHGTFPRFGCYIVHFNDVLSLPWKKVREAVRRVSVHV